jgi:hypothetical protein
MSQSRDVEALHPMIIEVAHIQEGLVRTQSNMRR